MPREQLCPRPDAQDDNRDNAGSDGPERGPSPVGPFADAEQERSEPQAEQARAQVVEWHAGGEFVWPGGPALMLVDDVLTTGSTLREATKTLEKSGFRVCSATVLAVTRAPKGAHEKTVFEGRAKN